MRTLSLIALLCALAIPVAGCGDDDEPENGGGGDAAAEQETQPAEETATEEEPAAGGGAQTLKISADPGGAPSFDKTELTAPAGEVTISMDNPSDVPHAVVIEGNGVEEAGETVQKDGVSEATAEVEAGEYTFYCPVGGHRAAGMEGTLTVE